MDQVVGGPSGEDQKHPQESISYSVLKEEPSYSDPPSSSAVPMRKACSSNAIDTPPTLHHQLSQLNLSSSSPPPPPSSASALRTAIATTTNLNMETPFTSTQTTHEEEYLPPITSPVGKLLFGEKVDALFDSGSSSIFFSNDNSGNQKFDNELEDNSSTLVSLKKKKK